MQKAVNTGFKGSWTKEIQMRRTRWELCMSLVGVLEQNYADSITWYEKAAEHGNAKVKTTWV